MKFLKQLPRDKRHVIIRLPYRVGLWVSQSDTTGGDESDREELDTLEGLLMGFTQEVFGSELVQHIMSATFDEKAQWPEWGENLDRVPEECQEALSILKKYAEDKEISAFKQRLMEIAEAVALAFRESDPQTWQEKFKVYTAYYTGALKARLKKRDYISWERYLNISDAERRALHQISRSLGVSYL